MTQYETCRLTCEDAIAVGVPEYANKNPNRGSCGRCAYYDPIVPPVLQYERVCALENIYPFEIRVPACDGWCQYGDCDWRQCGGCCGCLGGCQVAYENSSIAPFLWEGDYA